jgi:hypothetical protein
MSIYVIIMQNKLHICYHTMESIKFEYGSFISMKDAWCIPFQSGTLSDIVISDIALPKYFQRTFSLTCKNNVALSSSVFYFY